MQSFPLVATLKEGCVVLNHDMSYSDHIRKPNINCLKQNNTDEYTKTIKQLNKIEDITVKYDDITSYVKSHQILHDSHTKHNKIKGVQIKPLGLLSVVQLRKMRKAVENMTSTILFNYDYDKKPWENENYLAFVTLTIPYKQMHTDAFLRKKALIPFIDNLRKTYNVKYYIWKAEAQTNGNIHFHLIIDKFIRYDKIKRLWNKQLSSLGYIEKYANKRKKEGFLYQQFIYKKGKKELHPKSYKEQLVAFKKEEKNGFKQPNSTDIHSLKNIQDTSRYIMKYMEKQEPNKRPILGKIYGMSNETKKLDYPKISESEPLFRKVIHMLSNANFKVVLKDDFFSVHAGKVHDIIKKQYYSIWNNVKQHYKQIKNMVKEQNVVKETKHIIEVVKNETCINNTKKQLTFNYGNPALWTNNLK